MRSELFAAAAVVVVAVFGVRYWENSDGQVEAALAAAGPSSEMASAPKAAAVQSPYAAGWGEEVRIKSANDHQYYVTAAVNNAPSSFLIDTGASYVALRETDARRAGVYVAWNDFDHPVRTANGETKAALVTLNAIEINGIRVDNVKAFILADDQLGVNLLGMSFLSRLESVEAKGGELVLRG